jgi:Carboxypeptidase regulatory-like domain
MRIPVRLALLIFAVIIVAATQQVRQEDARIQTDDQQWVIEGNVTHEGVAIVRVDVTSRGPGQNSTATTNAMGHYLIKGVVPGTYSISLSSDSIWNAASKSISVMPGTHVEHIDFEITRAGVISGRVLDEDKNPISGVWLALLIKSISNGRVKLVERAQARTDDTGAYRLTNLRDGNYYLVAVPDILQIHKPRLASKTAVETKSFRGAIRKAFYPNVPSFDNATPIVISSGANREVATMVLDNAETHCVSGQILSSAPEGVVSHASVSINEARDDWAVLVASGSVKPDEVFEICRIPQGEYRILAHTWMDTNTGVKFKTTGFLKRSFVVSKSDVALGTLYTIPPVTLTGKLNVDGVNGEESVPSGLTVELERQGRPNLAGEGLTQRINTSGTFVFENIISDDYLLHVRGLKKGYYVREASQQGRDVLHLPLNSATGELRIVLGADGPLISGQTVDHENKVVHDALVILEQKDGQDNRTIFSTHSDQNGHFQFDSGIVPAEYRLLSLTGLFDGEDQDVTFLSKFTSQAEDVSLTPNSAKSITVKAKDAR